MPVLGLPIIVAPAIGVLAGGLGQVLAQWPAIRHEGFRLRPAFDLSDPGLREVLLLMVPGIVGLAAVQVNIIVNLVLAVREGTGAVSWLNYAFRLMYLPIGLFGVSIATAAVPALGRHAARGDRVEMRRTVSHGLRLMLMLNVPATVGLIALAAPIVGLIFERGRFTPDDTAATAAALAFYAPGLIGYSAVKLAVPAFYALRDSRTPVMVSVATVAVNIVLNLMLARLLGFRGLALGTALASLFNAITLMVVLKGRLDGLDGVRIANALMKITAASTMMGLAAWGTDRLIAWWLPSHGISFLGFRVAASITLALVVLDISARALRIEEFVDARASVLRNLRRARGHG
jgi:putative peptidoglycan lipid II flippase